MINDQDKLQILKGLLDKLSDEKISDQNMQQFISELKKLYDGDKKYRHRYSDISGYLYAKQNKEPDILQLNFEELYKEINTPNKYSTQFQDSFNKLYDHVNLECIRISQLHVLVPDVTEL